jgi:hypothetical protein
MLNVVLLEGRLVKDPELRKANTGTSFTNLINGKSKPILGNPNRFTIIPAGIENNLLSKSCIFAIVS